MGPKLSIGLADFDEGRFVNLTVGIKSFENATVAKSEFVYLDVQLGDTFPGQPRIFFGGGAGLLFGKEEGEYKIMPRTTIFFGFRAFPTLDFNFWKEDKISNETGLEVVLPIPLKKVDFGLE